MNAIAGRRPRPSRSSRSASTRCARAATTSTPASSDMDINGVWASLNFPSMITGFCGRVFSQAKDPELGLAVTRAWNDWLFEEWWSAVPGADHPARHHLPHRPDEAVPRRSTAMPSAGFRAVTLPERPHRIGLPSLFSGYWDPIVAACAETDTVICLHVGSSGGRPRRGRAAAATRRHAVRSAQR